MNNERWEKINELFYAALEHAPEQRKSYLIKACDNDEDLLLISTFNCLNTPVELI